jgi:hypothetical protein
MVGNWLSSEAIAVGVRALLFYRGADVRLTALGSSSWMSGCVATQGGDAFTY